MRLGRNSEEGASMHLPWGKIVIGALVAIVSFGAAVWGTGYVILPAAKLYQPIWKYDRKTLANDLSAHFVYGLATASVLRLLSM